MRLQRPTPSTAIDRVPREARIQMNITREKSLENENRPATVGKGELLQEPRATTALSDSDRLEWLMAQVCCDEIPGIRVPLGLSKEQHSDVFRAEIDIQILKARRG